MKRIVICMDGTWQNLAWQTVEFDPVTGGPLDRRTNVAKAALLTAPQGDDQMPQIVFYSPGVGARTFVNRSKDAKYEGATGEGSEENLLAAYLFLSFNYEPGDQIYLFGFSRGAFCVRSLAGLIRRCGILHRKEIAQVRNALELYRRPPSDESLRLGGEFRKQYGASKIAGLDAALDDPKAVRITYMGVFDTVVMRKSVWELIGLAAPQPEHDFHDLKLSDHVASARHALALDERRNTLPFRPWTNLESFCDARGCKPHAFDAPYQQKWFSGAHGDVGGGESRELSEVSRKWVLRGAAKQGLKIDEDLSVTVASSRPAFLDGRIEKLKSLWYLGFRDRRAFPLQMDDSGKEVRVRGKPQVDFEKLQQHVHPSAVLRMLEYSKRPHRYRPNSARAFLSLVDPSRKQFQEWLEEQKAHLYA